MVSASGNRRGSYHDVNPDKRCFAQVAIRGVGILAIAKAQHCESEGVAPGLSILSGECGQAVPWNRFFLAAFHTATASGPPAFRRALKSACLEGISTKR